VHILSLDVIAKSVRYWCLKQVHGASIECVVTSKSLPLPISTPKED